VDQERAKRRTVLKEKKARLEQAKHRLQELLLNREFFINPQTETPQSEQSPEL